MKHATMESLEGRALFAADLTPSVTAVKFPTANSGKVVKGTVSVALANAGDLATKSSAEKFSIAVFARPAGTAGESDILIGTSTKGTTLKLVATPGKPLKIPVKVPESTLPGTYSIVAIADPTNVVNENSETNNTAIATDTFLLGDGRPNLAVTSASTTLTSGQSAAEGSVTIKNTGATTVKGAVSVAFAATAAGQTAQALGSQSVNVNLKPGKSVNVTKIDLTAPTNSATGSVQFNIAATISPNLTPADAIASDNTAAAGTFTVNGSGTPTTGRNFGNFTPGPNFFSGVNWSTTLTFTTTKTSGNSEEGTVTDSLGNTAEFTYDPGSVSAGGLFISPGNLRIVVPTGETTIQIFDGVVQTGGGPTTTPINGRSFVVSTQTSENAVFSVLLFSGNTFHFFAPTN